MQAPKVFRKIPPKTVARNLAKVGRACEANFPRIIWNLSPCDLISGHQSKKRGSKSGSNLIIVKYPLQTAEFQKFLGFQDSGNLKVMTS